MAGEKMEEQKKYEGVMAVTKPEGITSADVIRSLQTHFNASQTFAPLIAANEQAEKAKSHHNRRRNKGWNKQNKFKLGHGGTLDPLATGVLITGIGSGTKVLSQFLACKKQYDTVVVFGVESDTYDVVGKVTRSTQWDKVNESSIRDALKKFTGAFAQKPPIYSAKWINGERAYDVARRGDVIADDVLKAKDVQVDEMELLEYWDEGKHDFVMRSGQELKSLDGEPRKEWKKDKKRKRKGDSDSPEPPANKYPKPATETFNPEDISTTEHPVPDGPAMTGALPVSTETSPQPEEESIKLGPAARIRMTVSSGFYVRSLCHDLGKALDSSGVMATLVRTKQGDFDIEKNVLDYDDLAKGEGIWGPKVRQFLDDWRKNSGTKS